MQISHNKIQLFFRHFSLLNKGKFNIAINNLPRHLMRSIRNKNQKRKESLDISKKSQKACILFGNFTLFNHQDLELFNFCSISFFNNSILV